MKASYFPASVVTETRASIILIAENASDREKLAEIAEFMSAIVIGESRCERTGETRIVEIGVPRTNGQRKDEGKYD